MKAEQKEHAPDFLLEWGKNLLQNSGIILV